MMSTILRRLIWGAMILTMASGVPIRVAADAHAPTALSPALPKECYPEGLYLYETETAGPDGCGIRVDRADPWLAALARDPRAEPERDVAASPVSSDRTAAETGGDSGEPAAGTRRRLLVDQAAQVMRVYENGDETRTLPVSTGMLTSKTFTRAWQGTVGQDMGAVSVEGGMHVEQAWYLFPDVFGNILIHSVPYVQQGSARVYDQLEALGVRPSSHGCIRISVEDAGWLRAWNPVGVPIEITGPPGPVRHVG